MTEVATSSRLEAAPRAIAGRAASKRTANMDAVLSRASADHDNLAATSSSPAPRPQTPSTPTSVRPEIIVAGANILHTPRRGRRVGVDMWGSPSPREAPQTFPRLEKRPSATAAAGAQSGRATRSRRDSIDDVSSISPSRRSAAAGVPATPSSAVSLTPRKRRAPASSSDPAPTLLDDDAWAAAGMRGDAVPSQPNFLGTASPGSSQGVAKRPTSSAPRYEFLALFCGGGSSSSSDAAAASGTATVSPLVPIDVGERGRLIVHRSLAPLFAGGEAAGSFDASSLLRGSDTEASANSGASTAGSVTSTAATSIYDTPSGQAASGPSPSFSLQSQFPASTHGGSPSPTPKSFRKQQADAATSRARGTESVEQVLARTQGSMSSSADEGTRTPPMQQQSSSMGLSGIELLSSVGSLGSDPRLPTLEWPDDPEGPWAASAQHLAAKRAVRLGGIARWLSAREDDAVAPVAVRMADTDGLSTPLEPSSFYAKPEDAQPQVQQHHQHPMIAKALRDRARREALARSNSLPNLHQASGRTNSPRKRARRAAGAAKLAKADSKTRKRLERKLAGAALEMAALDAKASTTAAAAAAAAAGPSRPRRAASTRRASGLEGITTPQALSNRASAAAARNASVVGCMCGHTEALGGMVQCDVCNMWFHLFCLGIAHASELDDEWFCDGCCERAMTLTPGSFDSNSVCATVAPGSIDGSSNLGTPMSAALAHQAHSLHQLELNDQLQPVFSQPSESPARQHSVGGRRFGALALAPSPRLAAAPSAALGSGGSSGERRSAVAAGRARANRIGWHVAEAGSPLERKSQHPSSSLPSHQQQPQQLPSLPSTPSRRQRLESFNLEDPFATPGLFSSETLPHGVSEHEANKGSPRLGSAQARSSSVVTPSHARAERMPRSSVGGASGSSGQRGAAQTRFTHGFSSEDEEPPREADDVFGTPSRIYGAPWGAAHSRVPTAVAAAAGALQTPGRRSSGWGLGGGLGTPSSGLLGAAFADASHTHGDAPSTAYSGGMPSLVFSSGGMEAHHQLDAGSAGEGRWIPQSPTSATRAGARARQSSTNLLRTPELQPRRVGSGAATSSVRGSGVRRTTSGRALAYDEETEPPSSSPFPRTPTFDDAGPSAPPFSTLPGSNGSPRAMPGSASKRLARLASSGDGAAAKGTPQQQQQQGSSGKVRNASSELNLGLGIGLDFEELLDWN